MPFDGIPVVHDGGDAAAIVASVAERTGLSAADLVATPLERLLGAELQLVGDAELRRCSREPTAMAAVEAELARAEAAFAGRDKAEAMDSLELAVAQMGCLSEVVAPRSAARGFLLRAALVAEQGDEQGARDEVRAALALDPEATWPSGGTFDSEALLAAERELAATATLSVLPRSTDGGPWVDGHPVAEGAAPLSPGLHLVQVRVDDEALQTAWVLLGGDATLVVPQGFRRPVLERMADPETRPEVEALLAAALPGVSAAYVVSGEGLWLVTTDEQGVLTIELDRPAKSAAAPGRTRNKKSKPKR